LPAGYHEAWNEARLCDTARRSFWKSRASIPKIDRALFSNM
jgi:hypothetical protein